MFDIFKSSKTMWSEVAVKCPDKYLKEAILNLFIPYKVSWRKFTFNMDCLKSDGLEIFGATQTCKYWCAEPWNRPMGYPLWFFATFPDVILWASEPTKGFQYIERVLNGIPEDELIGSNNKFTISVLKKIVQTYIDYTQKRLETA